MLDPSTIEQRYSCVRLGYLVHLVRLVRLVRLVYLVLSRSAPQLSRVTTPPPSPPCHVDYPRTVDHPRIVDYPRAVDYPRQAHYPPEAHSRRCRWASFVTRYTCYT